MLAFIEQQRRPRQGNVVRLEDGETGLSARTIKRRISTVSGLLSYLMVRGDITSNPVPRGLATRRALDGDKRETALLLRVARTLPRVVSADDANGLLINLRTRRDQGMVQTMLLGGLRRCEVLGLRLDDLKPGQNRVFVAEGKGGH